MITIKQWITTPVFKLQFEATLPAMRIVCPCCQGQGTTVNPAIDGNGLTEEDLRDEDFRESYLSGVYDETCYKCHGKNVIEVLDYEALSPKMKKAVDEAEDERLKDEMEAAMERRMGA